MQYTLRSMINKDNPMPLNQGALVRSARLRSTAKPCTGVLRPVEILVKKGSFLNPNGFVAVSGSTIAAQRLCDVILKAFRAAAASGGCASSVGFGSGGKNHVTGEVVPGFAYGETIGTGSGASRVPSSCLAHLRTGAGPTWRGQHAVSVHCTNTKSPDPEICEARTPLLLRTFAIRTGSGGRGRFPGGDGAVREFLAREDVDCSIVSQRRVFAPFGMDGAEPGARGRNLWLRRREDGDGVEVINVGNNGSAAYLSVEEMG
jgi:5-oxoprolinase (ATP-hydrolysing)